MFDAVFDAITAFDQLMIFVISFVFLGISFLIASDTYQYRKRAVKRVGIITAVKAVPSRTEQTKTKGIGSSNRSSFKNNRAREKDTNSAEEPTTAGQKVFIGLFLLLPLVFVAIGAHGLYKYASLKLNGEEVQAVVVDFEESYDSDSGTLYYPVVSFKDAYGETHRLQDNIGSSSKSLSTGDKITVFYDRDNPEKFIIDRLTTVLFSAAFGGLGLIFFSVMTFALIKSSGNLNSDELSTSWLYYPIIKYTGADGNEVEACETGFGNSHLASKIPGTRVNVFTDPDSPSSFRIESHLGIFMAVIMAIPGVILLGIGISNFEPNIFTLLILIAGFGFIFFKLASSGLLQKIKDSKKNLSSLTEFIEPVNHLKESGEDNCVILDKREVMLRLRKQDRYAIIWLPVMALISAGLIMGGNYVAKDQAWLDANGVRTEGTVIDIESVYNSSAEAGSSYTYYPVVRFNVRGYGSVKFRSNTGSSHPTKRVGDTVNVLYDPEHPESKAQIDMGWMNWTLPGLLFLAGALVALLCLKALAEVMTRGNRAV